MKLEMKIKKTAKMLIMSILLVSCAVFSLKAQENMLSVSGTVVDSETKRPMVFASVTIQDIGISIVTNGEGFFYIEISPGICR